ncbi:transposase [Allochromatium tepidum]|uniref:Transposase IS701-like DDE domain-containing protein n=1 Tax=Allochromatium tepidum TaxID=553982 RepID=A0ABN6G7F2_9GAMM|nr:transposase [Allochromatium tepidum]BCU05891.1 hypothetical protein Atep_05680 [Allochromatium tepidum]
MSPLPASIVAVLQPFACLFTNPTWVHVQVLPAGTLLAPGPRTVVVDETLERRKGAQIWAKGMYRDAVRSSHSRVVTCLGVQWICMALLVPVPWSDRPWALPFLTRLAPSQRANEAAERRHRTTVELTIGMVSLVARWLQHRRWVLVGDGAYAGVQLGLEALRVNVTLVSRLRLDARLVYLSRRPGPGAAWTQAQEGRGAGETEHAPGGGPDPGRADNRAMVRTTQDFSGSRRVYAPTPKIWRPRQDSNL